MMIYRLATPWALAITILAASSAIAAGPPVNQDRNGRIVTGGTYYNTPGNRTTFRNTGSGGLWVRRDSTVRGIEVNANGSPTNNGGTFHFYAPGSVVRIDGKVDVSSLRNGQGAALGNGGKVFIDSDYLYQSGQIFANGRNGGLVQINVAGATLAPGAGIQARGEGGNGGVVAINSSGLVDIDFLTEIDTSGRVSANFDTNVISIEGGSMVNVGGVLRADGVNPQFGGSRGGTIRLVSTGAIADTVFEVSPQSRRLLEQNSNIITKAWDDATRRSVGDTAPPTLQASEKQQWQDRSSFLLEEANIGSVNLGSGFGTPNFSVITANGTRGGIETRNDYTTDTDQRAGDGGSIHILSSKHLFNNYGGIIRANGAVGLPGNSPSVAPVQGGNGGTIVLAARQILFSSAATIEANGGRGGWANNGKGADSGDGGLIALSYGGIPGNYFENHGYLTANGGLGGDGLQPGWGGNGGLIVISATQNPMDSPFGGYPVVQANAGRGGNEGSRWFGGQAGTIVSPNPATINQSWNYEQIGYANGRTVEKPFTEATQTTELLTHAENLILLTNNLGSGNVLPNLYTRLGQARLRSVEDPSGSLGLARNEIIEKNTAASPYVFRNLLISSSRNGLRLDLTPPYRYDPFGQGSGLILPSPLSRNIGFTTLNTLSILNEGAVKTLEIANDFPTDFQAPKFDIWVMGKTPGNLGGGRISVLAHDDIQVTNLFGTRGFGSGGSIQLASGNSINVGLSTTEGYLFNERGLHGGSIIMKAPENIDLSYSAYYYPSEIRSAGNMLGGSIQMMAGNQLRSQGGLGGGPVRINANGSFQGGTIVIKAPNTSQFPGIIEARGSQRNGVITFN